MSTKIFTEQELLALAEEVGAYLKGHFLLTSGLHSEVYFEKFAILQYPDACDEFCHAIAAQFRDQDPDVVLGPAVGGILLASGVARHLNAWRRAKDPRAPRVRGIFLERDTEQKFTLKRGFNIEAGEKVLVVEDVVTTGKSVFEVLEFLASAGLKQNVCGIGYLVDRSGDRVTFGASKQWAPFHFNFPTWDAKDCPLCKQGLPLTKRGSRALPGSTEKKA